MNGISLTESKWPHGKISENKDVSTMMTYNLPIPYNICLLSQPRCPQSPCPGIVLLAHLSKMISLHLTINAHRELVEMMNEIGSIKIPRSLLQDADARTDTTHRGELHPGGGKADPLNINAKEAGLDGLDAKRLDLEGYMQEVWDCLKRRFCRMQMLRKKALEELEELNPPISDTFNGQEPDLAKRVGPKMARLCGRNGVEDVAAIILFPGCSEGPLSNESAEALGLLEDCCGYDRETNTSFCLQDLEICHPVLHLDEGKQVEWVPTDRIRDLDVNKHSELLFFGAALEYLQKIGTVNLQSSLE